MSELVPDPPELVTTTTGPETEEAVLPEVHLTKVLH